MPSDHTIVFLSKLNQMISIDFADFAVRQSNYVDFVAFTDNINNIRLFIL